MAVREIDESELLAQQSVTRAVNQMLANPKARKMLLAARKEADPDAVIPEIDAAAPLAAEQAALRQMLLDDKAERAADKAAAAEARSVQQFEDGWNRQKSALRNAGWRDEGIEAVEQFARENAIGDLGIAADAWEKRHPPAEPVQPNGSGSWGFFDQPSDAPDTFIKAMVETKGDNEGALDAEIQSALRDYRSQNGVRR